MSALHPPSPPTPSPLFPPSSGNSKYLSGSLPGVYAVLDVGNPGVFLQRVNGFQDVLSPVFHLWKQPSTEITHWALFKGPRQGTEQGGLAYFPTNKQSCLKLRQVCQCGDEAVAVPTLRTKVLSLSGISSGMVVLTSTMADRWMLTLGFEDWTQDKHSIKVHI